MATNSRYSQIPPIVVTSHSYDNIGTTITRAMAGSNPGSKEPEVYARSAVYRTPDYGNAEFGATYMANVVDNWHVMAHRLFNDPALWWSLADANPQVRYPLDLKASDILSTP